MCDAMYGISDGGHEHRVRMARRVQLIGDNPVLFSLLHLHGRSIFRPHRQMGFFAFDPTDAFTATPPFSRRVASRRPNELHLTPMSGTPLMDTE
jgi:hypothetical protein